MPRPAGVAFRNAQLACGALYFEGKGATDDVRVNGGKDSEVGGGE